VNTDIDNADRNRPEWARSNALAEGEVDARSAMIQEFVRDQLRSGMAPERVAELVHDAVVEDRFWVFTDMAMVAALEPRFQAVLSATNPPVRTFG